MPFLLRNSGASASRPSMKGTNALASCGESENTRGRRDLFAVMCFPNRLFRTTMTRFPRSTWPTFRAHTSPRRIPVSKISQNAMLKGGFASEMICLACSTLKCGCSASSGSADHRQTEARDCRAKVIFVTMHEDHDFVEAAFSVGAQGYVLKSNICRDLVAAVREVMQGHRFVSSFQRVDHIRRPSRHENLNSRASRN